MRTNATVTPSSSSSSSLRRKHSRRRSFSAVSSSSVSSSCSSRKNHLHPLAIVDILVLVLVLSSSAFLVASFSSHILHCLYHILLHHSHALFYTSCFASFLASIVTLAFQISSSLGRLCWSRRRCRNPNCKGLRKSVEFDVQLQTEDCLLNKKINDDNDAAVRLDDDDQVLAWKDIGDLLWKGGGRGGFSASTAVASASDRGPGKAGPPDYQNLKDELRKIAPPNGRAVLLFRGKCGCPLAKFEVWGPKRGRRRKKSAHQSSWVMATVP